MPCAEDEGGAASQVALLSSIRPLSARRIHLAVDGGAYVARTAPAGHRPLAGGRGLARRPWRSHAVALARPVCLAARFRLAGRHPGTSPQHPQTMGEPPAGPDRGRLSQLGAPRAAAKMGVLPFCCPREPLSGGGSCGSRNRARCVGHAARRRRGGAARPWPTRRFSSCPHGPARKLRCHA